MHKVAVVILNYNGKHFLEQFLPSVIQYSEGYPVIVADNCSTDNSISFLKKNYPTVKIIQLIKNEGFSKGYNLALRQVTAEYYILLNSDVEVTPKWIPPVISWMDKNESIAVCQPKIKAYHQKEQFEYAGAAGGFIDCFAYPFCRGRIFHSLETDDQQYDDNIEVFWATGACMFVRANIYHQIKGLDEDFFAHMEEIDFCWRVKNVGYKVGYVGASTVYHVGGGTLPKNNPRKTFLNFRNNLAMIVKNESFHKVWIILLVRIFLDALAFWVFLFRGRRKDSQAIVRAYWIFYTHLRYWLRKRQYLAPSVSQYKERYPKSIVLQYFLFRKKKYSKLT